MVGVRMAGSSDVREVPPLLAGETWYRLEKPSRFPSLHPSYLAKFSTHGTPVMDDSLLHPHCVNLIYLILFLIILLRDAFLARTHGPKETRKLIG